MKVINMTCIDSKKCHAEVVKLEPLMITLGHEPNNHVLFFRGDYDDKGQVKKSSRNFNEENKMDPIYKLKFDKIAEREFV